MGPSLSSAYTNFSQPNSIINFGDDFKGNGFLNYTNVAMSINRTNILNEKFAIDWGIGFFNVGYKEKEIGISNGVIRKFFRKFEYFYVPFSLKRFFGVSNKKSIYLGTAFSWMAQQKHVFQIFENGIITRSEYKSINSYHRINQFVFLGTSWAFKIDDRFDFVFDLQVSKSILGFNKHAYGDPEFYHIVLTPTIGLQYLIE